MCTFRVSCYSTHLLWMLVLIWVSPFIQDKKVWGLGWEESRLSCYDIRAEGALPPSKTVIVRVYCSRKNKYFNHLTLMNPGCKFVVSWFPGFEMWERFIRRLWKCLLMVWLEWVHCIWYLLLYTRSSQSAGCSYLRILNQYLPSQLLLNDISAFWQTH